MKKTILQSVTGVTGVLVVCMFLFIGSSVGQEKNKGVQRRENSYAPIDVPANKVKEYLKDLEDSCNKETELNAVMMKPGESFKQLIRVSTNSLSVADLVAEFKNTNKDWKYRYIVLQKMAMSKDERMIKPTLELLKDKRVEIRALSAGILGEMKIEEAVDPLIATLNDSDRQVRIAACSSLGKIGNDKAIGPILNSYKKEKDFFVRTNFIDSGFSKFKNESMFNQLIDSLKNDSHPDVRASAARTLGVYKDNRAVDNLINALNNDPHLLVKFYSALSLGDVGGEKAIESLKKILADKEQDELVINGAKKALNKLNIK